MTPCTALSVGGEPDPQCACSGDGDVLLYARSPSPRSPSLVLARVLSSPEKSMAGFALGCLSCRGGLAKDCGPVWPVAEGLLERLKKGGAGALLCATGPVR